MRSNVSATTNHVAGRNRHFAWRCNMLIFKFLSYCGYRELLHRFSASARDSGRQTSLHIEICMGINELKPNRYVGTKN